MDYPMLTARQRRAEKFFEEPGWDLSLDGQKCSICHEPLLPGNNHADKFHWRPIVRTGCGHIFKKACILKWLKLSDTCPYCRTRLPGTEPLELSQWRSERESIIQNMDAIVQSESNYRLLPSSFGGSCETTGLAEKQPRWLRALRFKGFLLLETSTDKTPTEPMQQLIYHLANDIMRMNNYEIYRTMNSWMDDINTRAMGSEYLGNVDDVLHAVVRDLRRHGVQAFLVYKNGDRSISVS